MITPRNYISYSQLVLIERSPELYIQQYIYGKKPKGSINMDFGSKMANALETGNGSEDVILDLMIAHLPKFELMDIAFEADLQDGKEKIKVLAKPDTYKKDLSALKEYKTSVRNWTQKMADESDQITFYCTVIWLLTKKIPECELVQVKTRYRGNKGQIEATGEILRFPTSRKMIDIIKMCTRIKRGWKKIKEVSEKELIS